MATTCTVTATITDVSNTNLLGNAYVRFRLRNFQGWVPVVQGSSVIVETDIYAYPNPAGVISQTIICNTAISPINTFYTVEQWNQGRITSQGNYYINGNTSLNTANVIGTAPAPQGPGSIVFQNNGAMNSSQTLLNLENTDGSVVLTDEGGGTINIVATGASISTAGIGGFFGAGIPMAAGLYQTPTLQPGAASTTGNQITAWLFQLPLPFTIRTVSVYVSTGATSATANFGIYSAAGNKLIDSGALTASSSAHAETATLGTPVTLPAGTYYFAQSATSSSATFTGYALASSPLETIINGLTTVKVGQAANSTSAGVMPATLGTISADSLGVAMAAAFFGV